MTTFDEAFELAKAYARNMGEVLPGIYLDIRNGKRYRDCFYFDFVIVDQHGNPPQQEHSIAGAPGVTVDKKTREVQPISFGALAQLKRVPWLVRLFR